MIDCRRCSKCIYFDRHRKYHHIDETFSFGCNKLAYGSCSDMYDYFNRLVVRGDKSCFVPNNQISMFGGIDNV